MNDSVIRAMARWPKVPAVYGWLGLDRRGCWRLRGERITHGGVIEFINRNYACTESGQWYFQNGPQRAFVNLEYTPWVYFFDGSGALVTHVGRPAQAIHECWLDEQGNLLLLSEHGIGLVCDRDLALMSECLCLEDGSPCDEDTLAAMLAEAGQDATVKVRLLWKARRLDVCTLRRDDVPRRFGFDPRPKAPAEDG